MSPQRLVSWIGHADLLAMASELGESGRELLVSAGITGKYGEAPGPIKSAVIAGHFDEVHLLSNYPPTVHRPFEKWLGVRATIHSVDLKDPTDYEGIFRCANRVLTEISKPDRRGAAELCILLSPGTPAMAVVWVLLGRSRYPARLYQTNRGKLTIARLPEDLFEEVIPELLRDRDLALQHLAAQCPADIEGFQQIIGDSQALRFAVGRAQRAALRDVPVLLLGESGTGKEMFATAIHAASRRKAGPLVSINCAAIPRELLESELFGHVKGAFTGAEKGRPGAFSRAEGGTLFLDEIGECEPQLQAKLLRVLQPPTGQGPCCREFTRVGDTAIQRTDVRIIAATNRNLQKEIRDHRFREDLYYRLAVITLQLPPLRERRTDIPVLARRLLEAINVDFAKQEPGYQHKSLSVSAMDYLKKADWPGNVRQLYNTLLQAAVMSEKTAIERGDIAATVADAAGHLAHNLLEDVLGDGFNLNELLDSVQRHYLQRAMTESQGNKTRAARLLGLKSYQALDAQLVRLKLAWTTGTERRDQR